MKTITTSSGKMLEIKHVIGPLSNGQIMVDLVGDQAISVISPIFENQASFRVDDDATPNKYEMYENYMRLTGVDRKVVKGVTRLTLERDDEE